MTYKLESWYTVPTWLYSSPSLKRQTGQMLNERKKLRDSTKTFRMQEKETVKTVNAGQNNEQNITLSVEEILKPDGTTKTRLSFVQPATSKFTQKGIKCFKCGERPIETELLTCIDCR